MLLREAFSRMHSVMLSDCFPISRIVSTGALQPGILLLENGPPLQEWIWPESPGAARVS